MYHPVIGLRTNKQESYLIKRGERSFTMLFSPASFTFSFFFVQITDTITSSYLQWFYPQSVHLLLLQRVFLSFWTNNSSLLMYDIGHLALLSRSACRLQDGPLAAGVCFDQQIHSRLPAMQSRRAVIGVWVSWNHLESPGIRREKAGDTCVGRTSGFGFYSSLSFL